ncbi:MAG: hypothetical protein ABFS03_06630 [Chloroflexota bacterium]
MQRYLLPLLTLILAFGFVDPVGAQWGTPPEAGIISPSNGEALQGVVSITGTTKVEGALSWDLSFTYDLDERETWFLIINSFEDISEETLTQWDTTVLTDGNYQLRLRIHLKNGKISETIITNLRVRNYTAVETSLPALTPTQDGLDTITPTETVIPIPPTPLPRNPIEISENDIQNSLLRGAQSAVALIALIGLYSSIRKKIR